MCIQYATAVRSNLLLYDYFELHNLQKANRCHLFLSLSKRTIPLGRFQKPDWHMSHALPVTWSLHLHCPDTCWHTGGPYGSGTVPKWWQRHGRQSPFSSARASPKKPAKHIQGKYYRSLKSTHRELHPWVLHDNSHVCQCNNSYAPTRPSIAVHPYLGYTCHRVRLRCCSVPWPGRHMSQSAPPVLQCTLTWETLVTESASGVAVYPDLGDTCHRVRLRCCSAPWPGRHLSQSAPPVL